jgi:hypothetical protein
MGDSLDVVYLGDNAQLKNRNEYIVTESQTSYLH